MTDFFFQMGLSNACFSLALAIVAMVVGATTKRPHLAHMLWLLVFVKLVTPPIVTISEVTIPGQPSAAVAINDHSRSGLPVANNREPGVAEQQAASLSARIGSVVFSHGKEWLPPIWLLGSVVILAWSLVRVCSFARLLVAESEVVPQPLQAAAVKIARRLELKTIPTICTTSARISPMVWWAGGKVRIVIPATLLDEMDQKQWQWILAHELAHVRRRDYLVRWLEWLACVGFWWNPVVWWAQRNLRATEEICCDALVLSCLKPKPRSYANSLLTAVEFLACPALRPPAMASEVNSGGFLERRFGMIVSQTPNRVNSRWLQASVLLCAIVVLPFGVVYAQKYDAVERRLGEAVSEGELTLEQAGAMMATLKKKAQKGGKQDELNAYFEQVWVKLQAAVATGKMSAKDAQAKMGAIKKAKMGAGKKDADYKAIGERLKAAVKAGKLTKEEAWAKWAAIKKAAGAKKGDAKDKKDTDYKTIGDKIKAAVKAGKLTEAEARAKWAAIKKAAASKERDDIHGAVLRKRLGAAVEAGRMTKEEARAKFAEIMKKGRGSRPITREDYARAEADLRKAVAEGKISGKDARARLQGMRKMMGEQSKGAARKITREDLARVVAELRKAVAEGKISGKDARARLEGMRKAMAERGGDARTDWEVIKKRIEGAVKSGQMTREEADAKYKEIRERMGKSREGDAKRGATRGMDWEGIKKRIEGAVTSGKMTREEADAIYKEIREGMAKRLER